MMMDMSGMSAAMMLGMVVIWLLVLAFLVLGIAAFIKSPFLKEETFSAPGSCESVA